MIRLRVWDLSRNSELPLDGIGWRFRDMVNDEPIYDNIELHQWGLTQAPDYRPETPKHDKGSLVDVFEHDVLKDKDGTLYVIKKSSLDGAFRCTPLLHDSFIASSPLACVRNGAILIGVEHTLKVK